MLDDLLKGGNRQRARDAEARLNAEHGLSDPFAAAVRGTRMPIIITDPHQPDNPIIFANEAFFRLTGYSHDEVIGQNCRFLQGPATAPEQISQIRQGIARAENVHVELVNYKKDGTPFWNALFVSPVVDRAGRLLYFFGSQLDVTQRRSDELRLRENNDALNAAKLALETQVGERTRALKRALDDKTQLLHELDHRVKNNLQLMLSLVNLEIRRRTSGDAQEALEAVRERLSALGAVHRKLYDDGEVGQFEISEFARGLVRDLAFKSGRTDVSLEFRLEPMRVGSLQATPIALILNDLVAGALRHAYQHRSGKLILDGYRSDGSFCFSISDDHFTPAEKEAARTSTSGVILDVLARQLDATIDWCAGDPRRLVRLNIPFEEKETQ